MTNIVIAGRKISASALSRKWPGAVVACKRQGADTLIEWDETAVPAKTEAEINTAQDDYAVFVAAVPTDEEKIVAWLAANPFADALIRALNKPSSDPNHLPPNAALTNAELVAKIKANLK